MKRTATAVWNGSGKEGIGYLTSQSTVLNKTAYSYHSRFEEGKGTNPEELVAAAHAGCFNMKLSFVLGSAGFTPDSIETMATITLENGSVTSSHLIVKARIPGVTEEKFQQCAEEAKKDCPISKLLNTKISMEASLL
ncbi:MAG TPA: OsmC family protein [Chitinophagaceae bacterium]|nr:OsmC family protein [Chitinophagaceae bacterium]